MIIQGLCDLLKTFLCWIASLLPSYHLNTNNNFFSNVQLAWQQAYSWSGVIPVGQVLLLLQLSMGLVTVWGIAQLINYVVNVARGSGA